MQGNNYATGCMATIIACCKFILSEAEGHTSGSVILFKMCDSLP